MDCATKKLPSRILPEAYSHATRKPPVTVTGGYLFYQQSD